MMITSNDMPAGCYCTICGLDLQGIQGVTIFYSNAVADYCFPCAEKQIFNKRAMITEQARVLDEAKQATEAVKAAEKMKNVNVPKQSSFIEGVGNRLITMDRAMREAEIRRSIKQEQMSRTVEDEEEYLLD